MSSSPKTSTTKVTTLSAWLLAALLAGIGLALLFVSALDGLQDHTAVAATVGQLGGLLVATGVITVAWDLVGRRAFADEVLAKARLSTDVVASGVTRITNQYLEDVEWSDLFRDVTKLDIVVAYGSTWRQSHWSRLEAVAARPGARVRVFLPDYRDEQTVADLADRFAMTPEQLVTKVKEAVDDFRSLKTSNGAELQVRLRAGTPLFSCYRFDSRAVVTLYTHSRRRTSVPTFVVANGSLFDFVYGELDALGKQSQPAPGGNTA